MSDYDMSEGPSTASSADNPKPMCINSPLESLFKDDDSSLREADWEPTEEIRKAAEVFSNSPYKKDDEVGWFFIKDVREARKVGHSFVIKDLPPFKTVGVNGRIRHIQDTKTGKTAIIVDDGTDYIRCLFDPKPCLTALADTEKMVETLSEAPNTADNQASLLFAINALNNQRDKTPSLFKVNDYVRICGHLREYEKTPYIYVTQGRRFKNPRSKVEFQGYILQIYKEVYPKMKI